MTIDDALKTARAEVKDGIAQNYLRATPDAIEMDGMHAFEAQIRYILVNLSTWRGEHARTCKLVIREWLKERKRERIAEEKERQHA